MAQRAITWDVAPTNGSKDPDNLVPSVLPRAKPRITRRVGVVRDYSPRKSFGLVESAGEAAGAIFNIEDVAPADRTRLDSGQTVSFHIVNGPDGLAAKEIRIDATTLPPLPDETMLLKGWR